MPTTRTIILTIVSLVVSAVVAGTALAQPPPDPSASASGSASPPTTPPTPTPTSDEWKKCVDDCNLVGKLVCGTDAAIQNACKGVPSCDALAPGQLTAIYDFCDQCRQEQKGCATTPPPVTSTTPTNPKSTTPVSPEQFCRAQGGIMVDGVCMTYPKVVDNLKTLRADLDALKARQDVTDAEIAALKKRVEDLEKAKGLPEDLENYLKSIIDPNMAWVKKRFENVDYKLNQMALTDTAISQRVDNDEKRIAKLEAGSGAASDDEGPGLLGFEVSFYGDVNTLEIQGRQVFNVGGMVAWVPQIYKILHAYAGVGAAFSGEDADGEDLKSFRVELGVEIAVKRIFHLSAGGRMDQTFTSFDYKHSAFYGVFATPSVCIPNRFTACIGASLGAGSITYTEPGEQFPIVDFTAQGGGILSFVIQP